MVHRIAIILISSLIVPAVFGQKASFGVVVGTNLSNDFNRGTITFTGEESSSTYILDPGERRLIIGPKLELRLPRNWSVEVDALHREMRSTETVLISPPLQLPGGGSLSSLGKSSRTHASWEFPILAKYRIAAPKLKPFAELGPSFRPAGTGTFVSHYGLTTGAGLDMHVHGFNVSPALRYTRWSSSNSAAFYLRPILDQVEFVVGFDQSSESPWPTAFGHRPSLGLVVGGSATDDFEGSNRGSYVVGAMAEFKLPNDLSVEIDGLYRKLRFSYRREVVLTWEFPLLAKYRFPTRRVKPLIELGPSFRATGNLNDADPSHFGFTAGAGIETTLRRLKIAPVVRFTRWAADNRNLGSITKPNQVELLVGFSF